MNESALPPARWLAPLLLATAALCWAGNHIIARAAVGHIQPWTLNALRWGLVSALIGVFAWRSIRRDAAAMRSRVWTLALLGAVGGGLFGGLQFQAANHTSALNMGVMNSVAPAFIVAAGIAFFRDSVSLRQVFGLVVSLAGVLAIVSRLDPERLAALSFNGGDLLLVFNMALWGGYSACLRLRPPTQTTSFLFASSVAALLVSLPPAALELMPRAMLEQKLGLV